MLLKLARLSLWHRKGTVMLTLCSLVISIGLLLGIDHLRLEAKQSFTSTVAGTDLIVGARSGQLNLLLYTVFRIGNATNNIRYQHYEQIRQHRAVAWSVPLALGDSHKGFRVLGTNTDYFKFFRYGQQQTLMFAEGHAFADVYDTVIGAEVAKKLGYQLGQQITLSHGVGAVSFSEHKDQPFMVVGILAPTGTPVDQSVHVSLQGIEAIHQGWQNGMPSRRLAAKASTGLDPQQLAALQPTQITGFMLGLKSKAMTFALQRQINEFKAEPLSAILPGAALAEMWQMLSMVENMLLIVTALVLLATLVGLMTTLLAAMKERQRELAILRALGARPWQIFWLIQLEVMLTTLLSIIVALIALIGLLAALQPWLSASYGVVVSVVPWHQHTGFLLATLLAFALLMATIPAYLAYRQSLNQGLMVKV